MNKALFLDRDGTLIIDKVYLADPEGVELIPGVTDGLRRARSLGYKLFLFTNQSGIGRGLHTLEDTHRVNARMVELIGLGSPLFDGVGIAPESPSEPVYYRKPSPRYIFEKIAEHHLNPKLCWMVGDSASDIGSGLAAKVNVAVVRTGKVDPLTLPEITQHRLPVYPSFAEFAATLT